MFAYCGNNSVVRIDPSGNCYYSANGVWTHDAWENLGGYVKKPDPHTFSTAPRDVTDEVLQVLVIEATKAKFASNFVYQIFGDSALTLAGNCSAFYKQVDHFAPWDIKRPDSWVKTIGTPCPGRNAEVIFNGEIITMDKLGNITYGFLGYAYGIPESLLLGGSYYAAGFPVGGSALFDEGIDWLYIEIGYTAAKNFYEG